MFYEDLTTKSTYVMTTDLRIRYANLSGYTWYFILSIKIPFGLSKCVFVPNYFLQRIFNIKFKHRKIILF